MSDSARMPELESVLALDWPAPASVKAAITTRHGGVSEAPFNSFNVAGHVGDQPGNVAENRRRLAELVGLPPSSFSWLKQIHGVEVHTVTAPLPNQEVTADASICRTAGLACVVMAADCLPVLLCNSAGTEVAAAHAGWRGLVRGVLQNTVAAFEAPASELIAYLGPAIGPDAFEVGDDVRQALVAQNDAEQDAPFLQGAYASCFRPHAQAVGKWWLDIYQVARLQLAALGVTQVYGGDTCTVGDAERFFSYRRDGITGRMASLIWLSST